MSAVPITMRNLPDIHSILLLKDHPQFKRHNYKILFDPSHATGISKYVRPMGIAAMLLGADGLEVEIHSMPDIAYSDKKQTINFPEFGRLLSDIKKLGENK